MILFSPTNDTSLMNKNTGDLNGAAGSICEATQENSLRSADFISLYSVEVNTAWGQVSKLKSERILANSEKIVRNLLQWLLQRS